jgi:hypothetical protein
MKNSFKHHEELGLLGGEKTLKKISFEHHEEIGLPPRRVGWDGGAQSWV